MAKGLFYRQCKLTREDGGSTVEKVAWLPEKGIDLAPGVALRIDEDPERWAVASVGETRQVEQRVKEWAHNWSKYHSTTDI